MGVTKKHWYFGILASIIFLSIGQIANADLEAAQKACVVITCPAEINGEMSGTSGSGFIATENGFIITNAHVICSSDITVTVNLSGHNHDVSGKLCYLDDTLDIAIIKIEMAGLDFAELGDDTALALGDSVYAIGSPFIFTNILTDGVFSSYNENLGLIQHTAELFHGNSGGPLVTHDGLVVGVNSYAISSEEAGNYYFAIPIHAIIPILTSISRQENITPVTVDTDERLRTLGLLPEEEIDSPEDHNKPDSDGTSGIPEINGETDENPTSISVSPNYVSDLITNFPEGFETANSPYGFSVSYPSFYTYEESTESDHDYSGISGTFSYTSSSDPYMGAVPGIVIEHCDSDFESYDNFKIRMANYSELIGEVKSEDSYLSFLPGSVTNYSCESCSYHSENEMNWLFFLRKVDGTGDYYCFSVFVNFTTSQDDFLNITYPLLSMFIRSFVIE
jgi:S1-C subfamily serine protease